MRTLIVGGTGMIGGHAALHLRRKGYDVAIAGRSRPAADGLLADLPFFQGDFAADDFDAALRSGFEAVVFAAGNDFRHLRPEHDQDAQLHRVNAVAVPRFFERAREAGLRRGVYIGSFYSQAVPGLDESVPYVRSRRAADEGARAATSDGFAVTTLNAPMIVGQMPGLGIRALAADPRYGLGLLPEIPNFAPEGGTNFMSLRSLSEAIDGALQRGEPGAAYLIGDENLSFRDYLGLFFKAAGRDVPLPASPQEHPLIPESWLYTGLGSVISYEVDEAVGSILKYTRNDIARAVNEIVAIYRKEINLPLF
jgi:nucleoside-diphosphate-sugar epimerase